MSYDTDLPEIKQIRVSDVLYNIKDQYAREVLPTKQDILYTTISAVSITPTVGIVKPNSPTVRRYGNVMQVSFSFRKGTRTSKGQNVFEGKITGDIGFPQYITGATYYNASALIGQLDPQGNVTVRVAGEDLAAIDGSGNWATISFTYFLDPQ